jgi:hypothetical protein
MTINRPLELFGVCTDFGCNTKSTPWSDLIAETPAAPYKSAVCPYKKAVSGLYAHTGSGVNCDKIRKAKPNPLIGNCIMRKTKKSGKIEDWIVCPSRFLQDNLIFEDCKKFLTAGSEYRVVRELNISKEGNLDFGVCSVDASGAVIDFVGIEVQACGTGGSGPIWDARNDFLQNALKTNYSFSMNEKDASKKILVQLLHKSRQIARWRKNTVLAIQDVFLEHLRSSYNVDAHFHKQDPQDFIHIHSYKITQNGGNLKMSLDEALSTDMVGLSMALISNPNVSYSGVDTVTKAMDRRFEEDKFTKL